MMKNLQCNNLYDAAIDVQRACDQLPMPDLHLLPYSRFSAEDSSLWWLCPIKAKTAFKQGKYVLGKPSQFGFESGIVCGLHIERGVKQTIGSPDWKLGPDWKWHDFINDFGSAVPRAVERAFSILAEPMEVLVFASTDGLKNVDRIRFTSTGNSLLMDEANVNIDALSDTLSGESWADLGRNLELLPANADWYWVDIFVISRFSLDPTADNDMKVCIEMLQCFRPWLGTA